ncbi:hypothetical protein FBUS_11751 [Fasciolopsis buskii]|uniref:Uncharacterized protein n=1 Tax=Fasciolopsis buskii TaxID=27845 RepID=A0A8E0RWJ5_9TREM|nr:hypothetical protein FBUS_11751 [Fasciolopsis buski]
MDLAALSGLIFIIVNVCLCIYYITQLVISYEVSQVLADGWLREHFHDLVSVEFGRWGVLIGESFVLVILLILLWWIVHRFGVREKYRLFQIRHSPEDVHLGSLYSENFNVNPTRNIQFGKNFRYLQRLAQVLESYGCKFRRQTQFTSERDNTVVEVHDGSSAGMNTDCPDATDVNIPSLRQNTTADSAMGTEIVPNDLFLEGGVELATCQWKDPNSVLSSPTNLRASTSRWVNLQMTEVHVIQSVSSRHRSTSYSHTARLLCVYGLVFQCLIAPHFILKTALDILQQNLAANFVQLSQLRAKWDSDNSVNTTIKTCDDMWCTLRDSFGCRTIGNDSYCFSTKPYYSNPYDQIHLCAESMQIRFDKGRPIPLCNHIVQDWIERQKWHSNCRIALFIFSYAVCISLIIRTVAWPITSSSCQTYPRTNWWKGSGSQSIPERESKNLFGSAGNFMQTKNLSASGLGESHGYYRF